VNSDTSREVATLRRLHELMCRVNAGDDLSDVLQSVVDGVADVTGFAVAAVSYLHPDQHFEVLAVAGDEAARGSLIGVRTPWSDIAAEFEMADDWGLLRFIPHERLNGAAPQGWIPEMTPLDVSDAWHPEDALLAPLSAPTGEIVGLLSVDLPRDGRRPGQFARDALEMYAAQAGIAISNAMQRARLREEVRLASVVRDVAQAAGAELEAGRIVEAAVAPIVSGFACDALWVRAFEGRGEAPGRGARAMYPHPPLIPSHEVVELAGRIARETWAAKRAAVVLGGRALWELRGQSYPSQLQPGTLTEHEAELMLRYVAEAGCRSLLLAPVGAGPECLGYLLLGRADEAVSWTTEEVDAALEIGRDLGRAVLHARLFQELHQLDRYRSEMISTLSHELKNPLTAIMGHLELLANAVAPSPARSLAAMGRAAERLSGLVDDLLLLAKVADPHRPLVPVPVDLGELVVATGEMLAAQAARQRVAVELRGCEAGVLTHGEPAELERMVGNLLGNAVKYSLAGGTVTCSLEQGDGAVTLRCSDEGLGISAEDQQHLFTEFYRSSNPAALEVPGTGLGLAIVRRIVERHRGDIAVESVYGRGTTFTVTLPTVPVPGPLRAARARELRTAPPGTGLPTR
jgi:signal transduction histidine kinase